MSFDPKSDFKKLQKTSFDTLREQSQMGWFKIATTYALAEMASNGASAEELKGVNRFISFMELLTADVDEVKPFPKKDLKVLGQNNPPAPEEKPADKK